MTGWLCDQGFRQCDNDPCLFVQHSSCLKIALYCDDLLVREQIDASLEFHEALESRFEGRPGSRQFLTPANTIDYTSLTLSMTVEGGVVSYFMDQRSEIVKFLRSSAWKASL